MADRPDLFLVDPPARTCWCCCPDPTRADMILGLAWGAIAAVALVGALLLRERNGGVTLACATAGIAFGAAHHWWEGRR